MGLENDMTKFCRRIVRQHRQVSLSECLSIAQEVATTYSSRNPKTQKAELFRRVSADNGQPPSHHYNIIPEKKTN